jgi:hypothetical protein
VVKSEFRARVAESGVLEADGAGGVPELDFGSIGLGLVG